MNKTKAKGIPLKRKSKKKMTLNEQITIFAEIIVSKLIREIEESTNKKVIIVEDYSSSPN